MQRYKLVYVDGYSEVLSGDSFLICESPEKAFDALDNGDTRRLINWDNVISIAPAKPYEGVIDKGQNA